MRYIPLSAVASIEVAPGPNQISRENGKRRIVVTANVRDRDLGSFVAEAQRAVAEKVKLPPGYWIGWGGQFEQLVSATKRLTHRGADRAAADFHAAVHEPGLSRQRRAGVQRRAAGADRRRAGAGAPRDIPLSISAGIGFIALSGVAVLNGLVIIAFIERLREEGRPLLEAVHRGGADASAPGADDRAGRVASGFVPMAIATGAGAEVQRPLATVVIGGIISSTILTLLVLPALYVLFRREIAPAVTTPTPKPTEQGAHS